MIVFSIVVGIVISYIGEEAQPLAKLFVALDLVITQIVILIMWFVGLYPSPNSMTLFPGTLPSESHP